MVDTYGINLTYMLNLAGGAVRLSLRKARFFLSLLNKNFVLWAFLSNPKVSILQATQGSDTICNGPALKIGKILVYSANPWIESFAHTQFHDAISQQRSFYYTNDPKYKVFYYNLHSSRLAQE